MPSQAADLQTTVEHKMTEIDGENLKKLRERLSYTQQQLADCVHSSKQTISNIETGKTKKVHSNVFNKLTEILGCTSDYLAGHWDIPKQTAPIEGESRIIPIFFDYPPTENIKNINKACRGDVELIDKLTTCLNKSSPKQFEAFKELLDVLTHFMG